MKVEGQRRLNGLTEDLPQLRPGPFLSLVRNLHSFFSPTRPAVSDGAKEGRQGQRRRRRAPPCGLPVRNSTFIEVHPDGHNVPRYKAFLRLASCGCGRWPAGQSGAAWEDNPNSKSFAASKMDGLLSLLGVPQPPLLLPKGSITKCHRKTGLFA